MYCPIASFQEFNWLLTVRQNLANVLTCKHPLEHLWGNQCFSCTELQNSLFSLSRPTNADKFSVLIFALTLISWMDSCYSVVCCHLSFIYTQLGASSRVILFGLRGGYMEFRCDFCCLSNSNLGGSHSSSIGQNCNIISFFPPTASLYIFSS